MWCPHCRQDAPLVYRGVFAYCSACNEPRPPLSATSLNLAGRPSKVGGTASRVLGYGVLTAGLGTSVVLMLLFALLAPTSAMGYAVGIPLAIVSLIVGLALVYAGRRLHRSGADAEREARERALYGLAANRGGLLTGRVSSMAIARAREGSRAQSQRSIRRGERVGFHDFRVLGRILSGASLVDPP